MTEKDILICGHGSGRPAVKNLYTYNTARGAKKAPNGKSKGVVAVRRLKGMTGHLRREFVKKYGTIIGRNYYSQAKRAYVYKKYKDGKYYSDCSSSGMDTYRQIGFNVPLLNTAGIYTNDKYFEDVPVVIEKGHIKNPEVLLEADAILYAGNDPARPKQIGHVEFVYQMPGRDPGETYQGKFPSLANGRGWYQEGDGITTLINYPTQIKRLQRLTNWINDGSIAIDGAFGAKTREAVEAAQKALGVKINGRFDRATLNAAKTYCK